MGKKNNPEILSRRKLLKGLAALPIVYGMSSVVSKASELTKDNKYLSEEAISSLQEIKGSLPKGKLGKHEITRLVMGCNPMGGWSHSRDLSYVGALSKQWHTPVKMKETWAVGEKAGINITNITSEMYPVFNEYKKETGSRMLTVLQASCGKQPTWPGSPPPKSDDPYFDIRQGINDGIDIIYIQGENTDRLVQNEEFNIIKGAIELIRAAGLPAGIGAHSLQSILATIKAGITPDFYYKTFHHDKYWSATPRENRKEYNSWSMKPVTDHNQWNDNMWDQFNDQTIEAFNSIKVPLFGFKVLAAGAIRPSDGIRWAFENGADFVCLGMYDFQVVQDVNTTIEILGKLGPRRRAWYS
jgi:hypothetical protein